MKQKLFNILSYIPLLVFIVFYLFFIINGRSLDYVTLSFSLVLLLFISFFINTKKYYVWGRIALYVFTIWYIIMGNYDFLRWSSTIIGILVFMYYLVLMYLKKKDF